MQWDETVSNEEGKVQNDNYISASETRSVRLELPGIKMEDLDLRVEENHLILEGTRKRPEEYKEEDWFYTERLFGAFHRVVHLPSDVDADRVEARFSEGLLTIRLPKTRRAEGKKIDIKTA